MTTVGEKKEELKTKMYEVPIRSKENNSLFSVNAIGIPCISDEVMEVEVEAIESYLGLAKNALSRGSGKLDVLIGIDHANMHTGKIKQVGNPVARHSPLGWLVFTAASCSQQSATCRCICSSRNDRVLVYRVHGCRNSAMPV